MGERIVIGNKYEYWTNQRLAIGPFTEIFQVKNITTQQDYALKIIKQSNYRADIYEQVCMQGKILMVLTEASKKDICPFFTKIEEYIETSNNNIYIILELCNLGNLKQKIKKEKKLPENETLHILFQLLQALVLLAKNNVAHRNIKPENIFIKDGIYKLGGFAMAEQNLKYETKGGTLPYMAPEIFTNDQYDQKVDVWALGLLIHEILFEEIYFSGKNLEEVEVRILTREYNLDDKKYAISDELKDLLKQMIKKDPKQRLTAEDALKFKIFDQFRTDPRYIQIMENEKQLLKQYTDDTSQKFKQQIQIEDNEI